MVRAWYMDAVEGEQRKPHVTDPPEFVDIDTLRRFGVHYWKIDTDNFAQNETLSEVRRTCNYDYEDQVVCQKSTMANYDEMISKFFQEHIHTDDETRLVLDGSGYFDVRHPITDRWIRIAVVKDDMISIPPGLYHRFTLDENDYIKVNRYFAGTPVWVPLNRPQDDHPKRQQYLANIHKSCIV
jgi:1,2-dihydroxy-3-keto-5-methylthiopentene dioxygenase